MTIKNTVFRIFLFLSIATYSQTQGSTISKTEIEITTFSVETDNLNELIEFDWESLTEVFDTNDNETAITLTYSYNNKFELDIPGSKVSNFGFKVTGKKSELGKLIDMSKKSIQRLVLWSEKNKK